MFCFSRSSGSWQNEIFLVMMTKYGWVLYVSFPCFFLIKDIHQKRRTKILVFIRYRRLHWLFWLYVFSFEEKHARVTNSSWGLVDFSYDAKHLHFTLRHKHVGLIVNLLVSGAIMLEWSSWKAEAVSSTMLPRLALALALAFSLND